jgi:hypothetical protein
MNPAQVAPQEDGLYLVPINTDVEGGVALVVPAVNPETALQASVDEVTGQFYFSDVSAGVYALVAVTDTDQQLSIRRLDTGEAVIVTLTGEDLGKVIDLGTLRLP